MTEEDILKKKLGTSSPFQVPEGYFERLTSEVMDKLPEQQPWESQKAPVSRWTRWKPYVYMAAMFAGAALIIRIAGSHKDSMTDDSLPESETEQQLISASVEGAMMDDYSLYVYLDDAGAE